MAAVPLDNRVKTFVHETFEEQAADHKLLAMSLLKDLTRLGDA